MNFLIVYLQDTYPDELLATALKAVIKQSGISPAQIGDICCGIIYYYL